VQVLTGGWSRNHRSGGKKKRRRVEQKDWGYGGREVMEGGGGKRGKEGV